MRYLLLASSFLALSACSVSEGDEGEPGDASGEDTVAAIDDETPAAVASGDAAAPQAVEREVNCATVEEGSAPDGQPADDIVGIRKGMSLERVRNILTCSDRGYAIDVRDSSIRLAEGGTASSIQLSADSGLERVNAQFIGAEGAERLVHVDRVVEFPEDGRLPVEGIKAELARKYGEFDDDDRRPVGAIVRARDGQRMSRDNSNYRRCQRNEVNPSQQLPCSTVVTYDIQEFREDRQMASHFAVAITDHAQVWDMIQRAQADRDAARERAAEQVQDGIEL